MSRSISFIVLLIGAFFSSAFSQDRQPTVSGVKKRTQSTRIHLNHVTAEQCATQIRAFAMLFGISEHLMILPDRTTNSVTIDGRLDCQLPAALFATSVDSWYKPQDGVRIIRIWHGDATQVAKLVSHQHTKDSMNNDVHNNCIIAFAKRNSILVASVTEVEGMRIEATVRLIDFLVYYSKSPLWLLR